MNRLINFNVKAFLIAAEELARADEVERALNVLNNLPAYYRDHEPSEVTQLRNEIMERIATPNFYKDCDLDFEVPDYAPVRQTLRYQMVRADIAELNKRGVKPHICEYAPGTFFIPMLLKADGLDFTYQFVDLGVTAARKVKPFIEDRISKNEDKRPVVFLALEVIEHLWNEHEIKIEMLKATGVADIIHISTPKYSYDFNCLNWKSRSTLGHLRAYTPKEFFDLAAVIFNEYSDFMFVDSQILHARGYAKRSKLDRYTLELMEG